MLATSKTMGQQIMAFMARIIHSSKEGHRLQPSEILVTDSTSPDWSAVLRKAAASLPTKAGAPATRQLWLANWGGQPWWARSMQRRKSRMGRPLPYPALRAMRGWHSTVRLPSRKPTST